MKNIFLLFFLSAFLFFSCSKEDDDTPPPTDAPAPLPVACFTVNRNDAGDPSQVFSFTNCSQNAVRYEWDFGDATYAPVANPIHIYAQRDTFIVRMNAYNSDDVGSTVTDTIFIGHYSLEKITFRQPRHFFPIPYSVGFFTPYVADTILSESMFPISHSFPDSPLLDLINSPITYTYRESDLTFFWDLNFAVYSNQISNNQLDLSFPIVAPFDTIKFTLYFKVVHR